MPRRVWSAVGLLVVVAIVLPSAAGAALAGGALALVVLVTAWIGALRRGLRVEVRMPARALVDEHLDVAVVVTNASRWPAPRVRVQLRLPTAGYSPHEEVVELALPPRRARTVPVAVTAYARGRWRPAPLTVLVSDPWGLVEAAFEAEVLPEELVVLPTLVPVRRLDPPAVSPLVERGDPRSLLEDPLAIVGVREYTPGDPLRAIHWPATAAAGTLLRREVERARARDLLVVLDLDDRTWARLGQRPFEIGVTTAASLLAAAVRRRETAALLASQPSAGGAPGGVAAFRPGSGRRHLDAMLVHLAGVGRHRGVPVAEVVRRHARRAEPGTTVVVVTPRVTAELAAAARSLRPGGLAPLFVHVDDPLVPTHVDAVPTPGDVPLVTVLADGPPAQVRL